MSHDDHGERPDEEGRPPVDPVDHVPDPAVSSETTPPDPSDSGTTKFSGTGVPGAASDSEESLPPGDTGVDDPRQTMEAYGGGRPLGGLRRAARRLFRRRPGPGT